jgi:hypothetical protein
MVYGVVSDNIVTTNSTSGIFIKRECTNVIVSDNILQSPYNLGDGITVNGTHLTIISNKILGFQNAINMTGGGGSFTTIRNNELKPGTNFITTEKPQVMGVVVEWNDVNGSALLFNQSSVQFRYNTGYRTECGGSVTNSTATTFYIQHGLVNTPVFVSVSFNATSFSSKWYANSTTITITIAGAPESSTITCYYEARTWNSP